MEVLVCTDEHEGNQWQHGDHAQIQCPDEGNTRNDVFQVLDGWTTCAHARDEATLAFHVIRDVLWVERDRHVEVREEDRHEEEYGHVQRVAPVPKYCCSHTTQPAGSVPSVGILNSMRICGSIKMEDAKITGITPAMLTLIGM